ncbi:MAG: hypothetical protein OS130_08040 [Thermodesulfobacteriota bacterium]|jgi:hypothetical protein|nr:MAG: hypothetical protein OS130_08040 [Thermodesulfobacteriota bacterium]
MKKKKKHPKDMKANEVMEHVFHPKVAKHLRKHVEKLSKEKEKSK